MPKVQVRGVLPALILLTLVGAGVALVVFASFAVVLPIAAGLLLLGLLRSAWYRLTGRTPPPTFRVATFRTIRVGPPGPSGTPTYDAGHADEGPVVEALPRTPSLGEGEDQGERSGPGA